ncbi:MAG: glycosyltransferase family 2 protein [Terriglobia bacterium]
MNVLTRLFRLRFWLSLSTVLIFLPFDFLVGVCLLLSDLVYLILTPLFPHSENSRPGNLDLTKASIVVLNWEGRHLLEEFLPSVVAAVREDGRDHEILVVDNGSTDDSVSFLKAHFPEVRLVLLPTNMRYTGGNNAGIKAAKNDIVIFLNNDMQVDPNFIKPLLEGFDKEEVFSVSCQVFFQDKERRREETGKTRARWIWGFLEPYHDQILSSDVDEKLVPIFWGGGGSCAFDKRKVQSMGGLDRMYDPFYLEDTDLSYQAWKRGWKSMLAVDSVVVHRHRGTNKLKFGDNYVDNTIRKNQYLFIWKNITFLPWSLQHLFLLPIIQAKLLAQTSVLFEIKAFFRAFIQLPEAMYKRQRKRRSYVLDDPEIFQETAKRVPRQGKRFIDFAQADFTGQLGEGWHDMESDGEKNFRWTTSQCGFFLFSLGGERNLEIQGMMPDIKRFPDGCQEMELYHNGKRIYKARLSHSGQIAFTIPLTIHHPGAQSFKLCLRQSFCPARSGMGNDQRELGVIVTSLRLV